MFLGIISKRLIFLVFSFVCNNILLVWQNTVFGSNCFIKRFKTAVSVLVGPCCPALLNWCTCAYCCIKGQTKSWRMQYPTSRCEVQNEVQKSKIIRPHRWRRSPPLQENQKIFLNVSENKSSDRKLICTFWHSWKRFWHYTERINTAASGGDFAHRPSAGTLPPAYPMGAQLSDLRFAPPPSTNAWILHWIVSQIGRTRVGSVANVQTGIRWTGHGEAVFTILLGDGDRSVTRGNHFKLSVNYCRTNTRRKKLFSERVVEVWNSLAPSIARFSSLTTFRDNLNKISCRIYTKYLCF